MALRFAVGHRGAPFAFPANTMKGFAHARALGCEMVECDIRRSADCVLCLAHDETVGELPVAKTAYATLATRGVPTLDELVAWAQAADCAVMADMKAWGDGIEEATVAALAPLPSWQKIVPGAPAGSRALFRALDPTLPISLSLDEIFDESAFAALLPTIDTDAVTWRYRMLTPERIATLQGRGLRVFAWTVDDEAIMRSLIAAGVDGVISNRPDLLIPLRSSGFGGG